MWRLGHAYLSVHQESDGQCHVQSTFRLDLDGLHLWLDMRRGRGQQERCWSQLIGDLSTPGLAWVRVRVRIRVGYGGILTGVMRRSS